MTRPLNAILLHRLSPPPPTRIPTSQWSSHSPLTKCTRSTRLPLSRPYSNASLSSINNNNNTNKPTSPLEELSSRGLISQLTHPTPNLTTQFSTNPTKVYTGFDPTASSLHVGNLLTIIVLLHFKLTGHEVLALVGGATGFIGDPSGRVSERKMLSEETIRNNTEAIRLQLEKILVNGGEYVNNKRLNNTNSSFNNNAIQIVNNLTWFQPMSLLTFLSTIGRFARVGDMLRRDSVKSRMTQSDSGISFTEFSYQLLQAFDFAHLVKHQGVKGQIGGSDQWGNIMAGVELIRKSGNAELDNNEKEKVNETDCFGLTIPLVTTSSGEKFGKSAGNAIWLDASLTPVMDFYQFFRTTPDDVVGKYLKYFTFCSIEEIEQVLKAHTITPEKHLPQRLLAREVTALVHGVENANKAELKSRVLFDHEVLSGLEVLEAFEGDAGVVEMKREEIVNINVMDVATKTKATSSKTNARKLIEKGGLYVNNVKVKDINAVVQETDVLDDVVMLIRVGKNKYTIVRVI